MNKNKTVSALISQKKTIYNKKVKNSDNLVFQLGGVGAKSLKVRVPHMENYPHLDLSGFIKWSDWEELTPQELELIGNFYKSIPK